MFVYADRMNRQLWNFVELCSRAYKKFTLVVFSNDCAPLEYKLKSVKISPNWNDSSIFIMEVSSIHHAV